MECSGEMGIDTDLRSEPAAQHSAVETAVPDAIETVRDERVDAGCLGEEAVHTHDAGGQLVFLVADERGLLEHFAHASYVRPFVERKDGQRVGAESLAIRRNDQ